MVDALTGSARPRRENSAKRYFVAERTVGSVMVGFSATVQESGSVTGS
jgi:hypothetical protein